MERLEAYLPAGYLEAMEAGEVSEFIPENTESGMRIDPVFSIHADGCWDLCHLGIGARFRADSKLSVLLCRQRLPGLTATLRTFDLSKIGQAEQELAWLAAEDLRKYCEFVVRTGEAVLPSGETGIHDEDSAYRVLRACDEELKELNFSRWADEYRDSDSHVEAEIQTGLFGAA